MIRRPGPGGPSGPLDADCGSYSRSMAHYRIEESESAVTIDLAEVGAERDELLDALGACQAGQCSCPTHEYRKLAAMDVDHGEDDIRLKLVAKPGEKFDLQEISACLDYMTAKATASEG